jgi:DNA polymerase-3 subunit alpha
VRRNDDEVSLMAADLTLLDVEKGASGPVVVRLPAMRCTPPLIDRLKSVLADHPGKTEVHLQLDSRARTIVMRLEKGPFVAPSPALFGDLKALLGPSCLG